MDYEALLTVQGYAKFFLILAIFITLETTILITQVSKT